ncbi:hypothetical protein PASE110613_06930 [Paenibacillus sediminis]|uniref:GNAT family N-acetyltransferase n=1 Tax=Paenibacillus sediminis TaxID=664909 RepID=A0ABS4H320_9BACL|nr:hypothetical protein [Paenibacillus sediminis]MBP1936520.1 hypothetical protein [Paenibacillus sediminis]
MIEIRELNANDVTEAECADLYEMILEIGRGQNGFVNSLYADEFICFQVERNVHVSKGIDLPSGQAMGIASIGLR